MTVLVMSLLGRYSKSKVQYVLISEMLGSEKRTGRILGKLELVFKAQKKIIRPALQMLMACFDQGRGETVVCA